MVLIVSASIGKISRRRSESFIIDKKEDEDFGWYQDFESYADGQNESIILPLEVESRPFDHANAKKSFDLLNRVETLKAPPDGPPLDVLESSLSDQRFWYQTAGKRPRQPIGEREYFEKLWQENFESSNAISSNSIAFNTIKSWSWSSLQRVTTESNSESSLVFRGKGPYSTAVSRSYDEGHLSSITIQLPYFRVVRDHFGRQRAEFLIAVSVNNVKFGVWRRYSHFKKLARDLLKMKGRFPNTLQSWGCVTRRLRWFRCLNKEYLAMKNYLLERFMQDLVFESDSPCIIYNFLDLFEIDRYTA